MWKLPFALIAFGFSIGLASAQGQIAKVDPIALKQSKATALARLSGEYLECSSLFLGDGVLCGRPSSAGRNEDRTRLSGCGKDGAQTRHLCRSSSGHKQFFGQRAIETVRRCSNGAHQTQLLKNLRSVGAL